MMRHTEERITRKKEDSAPAAEVQEKKRPGRRPQTPEEKVATAKLRAAAKAKAENLKAELVLQYQGLETDLNALTEVAKAEFRSAHKRTLVTDLKLYIKPEDRTAYYVINETFNGKIPF